MPTNPITIYTSSSTLPNGGSAVGTFVPSNGAVYSVINYVILGEVLVTGAFKSTDGGATWTEQDQSNQPIDNCFNACMTGDKIVSVTSDGSEFVNFYVFDTASDTWGSAIVTNQKYGAQLDSFGGVPYLDEWDTSPLCGRADGTVVLGGITYTRAGAGGLSLDRYLWWRPQYMILDANAGTWGSWTPCGITDGTPLVDTSTLVNCSIDWIVEGDGMVHFIFSEWNGNFNGFSYLDGTFQKLVQQPFSDGDSLGSMSDIKSIGPYSEIDEFGNPSTAFPTAVRNRYHTTSDGTTVLINWTTSVTSPYEDLTVLVGTSADPISFAETDLTIANAETGTNGNFFYSVAGLISTAGNYVFLANADGSRFGYWLDSGSGFGTFHIAGTWDPYSMTAVWIGAPYNTWGASGNGHFSFTAQFWNPLFGGGAGKGPRSYAFIGNAPFGFSR